MKYTAVVIMEVEMLLEDVDAPSADEARKLLRKEAAQEVEQNGMLTVNHAQVTKLREAL